MKDIEKLFERSGGPRPRRRLRANFTQQVLNRVEQPVHRRSLITRVTEKYTMKLFTKPVMAVSALVIAVALSGTAYAAIGGWPGVVALFGGQKDLSNGERIVRVDTENCTYPSAFNITNQDKNRHEVYYKLKANSQLSNEQVVQMVKGNCHVAEQAAFDQKTILEALNANPLNKDRIVGGYLDSEVLAVGDSSVTLKSVVPYGDELRTMTQTFPVADDVLVYESPNKLSVKDLRVGDHVSIKYRATGEALSHSETIAPDQVDASKQLVVAIIKNTSDTTAAVNFAKYNGSEFQEVVPCDDGGSGYCTYEQMQR